MIEGSKGRKRGGPQTRKRGKTGSGVGTDCCERQEQAHRAVEREEGVCCARDGCVRRH